MPLGELIEQSRVAIAQDTLKAKAKFSVQGGLVGLTEVDLTTRGHAIKVDEPPVLGGQDLAANPVEFALISLASCQAITYRFWAAQLGIELDGLDVEAEGDLDTRGFFGFDDSVRAGFTAVRVSITPRGPESEERYRELAEAVDAHCPVLDLFRNPTPVETRVAVAA